MMMRRDGRRLSEAEAGGEVLGPDSVAKALKARRATRRAQALLAAAGEMVPERRWAILRVDARRENDVDNLLSRAMIEHWLPLRKADETAGGKRRGTPGTPVWTIAWPGYLFVKLPDTAEAWHGLMGVKHVRAVLGVGEEPFFMDDANFLKLKAELATLKPCAGPETMFVEGERVMVSDGPFASFPGRVTEVAREGKAAGRARVEVMIFGRVVPVELDLAQIAKAR
jgi:transcription termination/antitermination protein NusG